MIRCSLSTLSFWFGLMKASYPQDPQKLREQLLNFTLMSIIKGSCNPFKKLF
jgi:hypothetical protein